MTQLKWALNKNNMSLDIYANLKRGTILEISR